MVLMLYTARTTHVLSRSQATYTSGASLEREIMFSIRSDKQMGGLLQGVHGNEALAQALGLELPPAKT